MLGLFNMTHEVKKAACDALGRSTFLFSKKQIKHACVSLC